MDLQRRHSVSGVEEAHSRTATGSKDLVGEGDGSDDEKMVIDEDKGKKSVPECTILSKSLYSVKKGTSLYNSLIYSQLNTYPFNWEHLFNIFLLNFLNILHY